VAENEIENEKPKEKQKKKSEGGSAASVDVIVPTSCIALLKAKC